MKRVILLVVVGVSLLFTSCASMETIKPIATPITIETPQSIEPIVSADVETRLMNNTWISPAKIDIGNYYAGARAEWNIRIHNSNEETTQIEKKSVGTFENETVVDISLKFPLADNDITKVTVTSDYNKDSLVVIGYTPLDKVLKISGFMPSESRIISIVYKAWTEFQIKYREPSYTFEGYSQAPDNAKDWIIITDSTLVFRPKETKEVLIALDTSQDTIFKPILTLYVSEEGKDYLLSNAGNKTQEETPKYQLLSTLKSVGGMAREHLIANKMFGDNNDVFTLSVIDELLSNGYLKWSNPKQWEFWTVYPEGGQGTLQQEMGTRWIVKMRQ